ncbi:hypothetical protein [Leptonema illini]|jgi:hypothetical protein|uniref:Transglycosylase SLT domain-containing protein n=1 Tax=Leptonema illini DSM 21528 TaxID=929563 RepID=H2CFG8_9LEPT|nr:hypothetical protein [Leptonema illini]EHQ07793.1 hypothetical protein Lepil_3130 [Leptonema illini DSM 21528]
MPLSRKLRFLIPLFFVFLAGCPRNQDDAVMLHIYHRLHPEIEAAVDGTEIPAAFLAALISLESHPPGNRDSRRFEPKVYQRLLEMKNQGRSFGRLPAERIRMLSDAELRELATSYGLTQIMGYHCLDLGCSIQDLSGEYHLLWSIAYMQRHYLSQIVKKDWEACFRIHNTGRAEGTTHRNDYAEKGLLRMQYYAEWEKKKGNLFAGFF